VVPCVVAMPPESCEALSDSATDERSFVPQTGYATRDGEQHSPENVRGD
jgi:hypothetical protein